MAATLGSGSGMFLLRKRRVVNRRIAVAQKASTSAGGRSLNFRQNRERYLLWSIATNVQSYWSMNRLHRSGGATLAQQRFNDPTRTLFWSEQADVGLTASNRSVCCAQVVRHVVSCDYASGSAGKADVFKHIAGSFSAATDSPWK